jgi:flavodoxin I
MTDKGDNMKALITYFSQTGNTKKVGQAICEVISQTGKADFKPLSDVENQTIKGYDLLVIGAPIHSGGLPAPVMDFLGKLDDSPGFKMAAFVTHMSAAYQKENFEKGIAAFRQAASDKGITFLGIFDCQGKLADAIQPIAQKAKNIPDVIWRPMMDVANNHPDVYDIEKAMAFARGILAK